MKSGLLSFSLPRISFTRISASVRVYTLHSHRMYTYSVLRFRILLLFSVLIAPYPPPPPPRAEQGMRVLIRANYTGGSQFNFTRRERPLLSSTSRNSTYRLSIYFSQEGISGGSLRSGNTMIMMRYDASVRAKPYNAIMANDESMRPISEAISAGISFISRLFSFHG